MAITTLRQLTGQPSEPNSLKQSTVILIDYQNTYMEGVMKLEGATKAMAEGKRLLEEARKIERPIFHVRHDAGPGTPYDVTAWIGAIHDSVAPKPDEPVITKKFINSFNQTNLHDQLQKLETKNLILAGFMSHMCVNSAARCASELGYNVTVVGDATATRALPSSGKAGTVVDAATLKASSLCELGDMFAVVVDTVDDLKKA